MNPSASHDATAATADHSRYVQRVRRRFGGEIAALPAGVPDAAAIAQLIDRFVQQGHTLAAALRIARHAVIERLAVLDVEQAAPLEAVTSAMTALAEVALERALRTGPERRGRVARRAARCRRPAHRFLDRRHGQTGRARTQRVVRHRPGLPLRRRGPDRVGLERARILRPRRQAAACVDRRGHRRGLRLSHRPGAAAQRQLRAAGGEPGCAGRVLSGPGPRMGTLRVAEEPGDRAARGGAGRAGARALRAW